MKLFSAIFNRFFFLSLIFLLIIAAGCGKKNQNISNELILAQVGDKSISVTEFYKRAEYTIRPPYCKMDNYIHKKIILNSLIAEKLFALEESDTNRLVTGEAFQNYIKGRKEQEMRKLLYRSEGIEKVKLDSSEIKKAYQYAGRKYKVEYFSVPSKLSAELVQKRIEANIPFEQIYQEIAESDSIPVREVEWTKEGNDKVHAALFLDQKSVGQVIGPIEAEDGMFTTMKILGWHDYPAMGEMANQRLRDVKERLNSDKALKNYAEFASQIMRGKKVDFNENTFFQVAEIVLPFYMPKEEQKKALFNQKFWDTKDTTETEIDIDNMMESFEKLKDQPFLNIDGKTWTVQDLRDEISIHPLVFRNRNFGKKQFPQQFKLAIVDLIRDKYLAEEAYNRGYDKAEPVTRNINMWVDNSLSIYHLQRYLSEVKCEYNYSKDYMQVIHKYLNPHVDSLQQKYSDQILINMDIFEKLKLTRIDMYAVEKNVPYEIIVPSFPVITDNNRLNYGKNMEE